MSSAKCANNYATDIFISIWVQFSVSDDYFFNLFTIILEVYSAWQL